MQFVYQKLRGRWDLIALGLMLEFLHFSIWIDFGSQLSRSFMLIHLGLFLIWQPVWRSDERLSWQNSLIFFVLTLTFVIFLNWWLMFGWLILLSGFAGGRVAINRQERNIYLLVLLFLTLELLIECTTMLFQIPVLPSFKDLFSIVLPLLPLVIASLPKSGNDYRFQSVDILHALSTSTLIGILIFGSLLNMYLGGTGYVITLMQRLEMYQSGTEYVIALIQTLIVIALFLFVISWLLSPRTGFSGLSQLWSRSLLNLGTPFEKWLSNLDNLSQQQKTPIEFLEASLEDLLALPWVVGVKWQTDGTSGVLGDTSKHETVFNKDNFIVGIYSNNWMGGALYLHCNLLIQLIDNFYIAKVRERQLTQQAHLKAIYETGARVTHDIKNLLQSLHAITSIIHYESSETESKSISHRLLERQLPHLTQRLQLALDKLQTPNKQSMEEARLADWWDELIHRDEMINMEFHAEISEDALVPVELLDSVVENMIENLREKNRVDGNLQVKVSLLCNTDEFRLSIADNGKKIPNDLVKDLLREPVKSNSGLGVGLYQVARLAEISGFEFKLQKNIDGNVCFVLSKQFSSELAARSGL